MKRKVKIELVRNTWFVLYEERKKHQRFSAAQFDARDKSKSEVERWVRDQPNLELNEGGTVETD